MTVRILDKFEDFPMFWTLFAQIRNCLYLFQEGVCVCVCVWGGGAFDGETMSNEVTRLSPHVDIVETVKNVIFKKDLWMCKINDNVIGILLDRNIICIL